MRLLSREPRHAGQADSLIAQPPIIITYFLHHRYCTIAVTITINMNAENITPAVNAHNASPIDQQKKIQHQPLDHQQQSIRLVTVEPKLSDKGLIRCRIRRTTINANCQCLSYRRGSPQPSQLILTRGTPAQNRSKPLRFLGRGTTEDNLERGEQDTCRPWRNTSRSGC